MNEKHEQFHVGVKGVLRKKDTVLILYHKRLGENEITVCDFPGGRMNVGETIEGALVREVKEELPTINTITVGDLLLVKRYDDYLSHGCRMLRVFYRMSGTLPEIRLSDEHESYEWVTLERAVELEKDPTKIINTDVIRKALSDERFNV